MQRKLVYQFPLWLVKPVLGPVAWRFLRDLGGMKSPILDPYFGSSQRADCTGVCRPFSGGQAMILGSTPADRSQEGSTPAVRSQEVSTQADGRSLPWSQVEARLAVC
ncbi:unnamed protein product [Staurois parvus]|uniref:Uncharacterized protein n=1 Tax=Staurois parvus TaxID=386267 RepID=A0ABN9ERF4_9NEOB|nr:unnamed protein product [Staurois parvus]CAI9595075.1 unnamed protein product [Staurois parvus]CAI9599065.1 unnamed protein product [Staurois parvus]CAI9599066.1 unnamed protein product [Staurois parvus]